MIPWTLIDTASVPGGSDELRLKQRGTEFSIMLGTNELMNSRLSGSEEALARLSCDKIRDRPRPRILIGGLGMGFTLRAALAEVPDVDNGPEALTRDENDRIYDLGGLGAAKRALRPGGVLSVWSSAPDSQFTRRLKTAGFTTDEVPTRANGKRGGARHMIWVAAKDKR